MFERILLALTLIVLNASCSPVTTTSTFDASICNELPQFSIIRDQIRNNSGDVQKIIDFVLNGADKGVTYNQLATFVDKFGSRLSGTENLENAIDYMSSLLQREMHDNVHTEDVSVPTWTRGAEWAEMVTPRRKPMNILSLGTSVNTGGVIQAQVIVVKTFDELKQRAAEVAGKMVVYNFDFQSYGQQVQYRVSGASQASRYGAVAALIRSVTPLSIDSPHTGHQVYDSDVKKIPAVSITVEDAELFYRLTKSGHNVTVQLFLSCENGEKATSRNTVSEVAGTVHPEQVVLVSGHLDSWDVGQGAMDDGGGAFISWRALSVIKKLNLTVKRTLRSVLWTAEEFGYVGAQAYLERHISELSDMSIVMESDGGTFKPTGLSYSGTNKTAQCIVSEVLQLLNTINATTLFLEEDGSDIELFMDKGVPGSSLENESEKYMYFHHSNGDTMTVETSDALDLCTVVWAATSYVFAKLDQMLPR